MSVDGNDPEAMYEVISEAVNRARSGQGVTFVEAKTCRHRGHFEGDPWHTYRSQDEVDECKKLDPIPRFRNKLISMKLLTDKQAQKIRQEALSEMDEAIEFAKASPYPDPQELYTDVYA